MFIDKRLIAKIQIYLSRIFTKSLNHRLYFINKAIPFQEPPSLLLTQKDIKVLSRDNFYISYHYRKDKDRYAPHVVQP